MRLYHWSCLDHGAPAIEKSGLIVPHEHPLLGFKVSWWSHVPWAPREALGLSSLSLKCDRMSRQYVAEFTGGQAADWPSFRAGVLAAYPERADGVRRLEATPGVKPTWWWVASDPIRVLEEMP